MAFRDWILSSLKAVANGVATLDGSGLVPFSQVPVSSGEDLAVTTFNTTNISASSNCSYQWIRFNNYVMVTGQVTITENSNNANTILGVALPIASNFTLSTDIHGVVNKYDTSASEGIVNADTVNDRALLTFYCGNASAAHLYHFHFSYKIKP